MSNLSSVETHYHHTSLPIAEGAGILRRVRIGADQRIRTDQGNALLRIQSCQTHATKLLLPLACTGLKPHFLDKIAANGVLLPPTFFELETPGLRPALAGGFA